ncbi:MAG: 23S rRNA (guanosine(2251)-2'-O)-methyltransferase RlmB [Desulfobacterota bacterium]|nr:23S rRNA (guanosine(2251)-2'-O)-methyltransferase RlmB [Thermodesulfobacteriota bacterium]
MSSIIYGIHPVREALLSSTVPVKKILISTKHPSPSLQSVIDLAQQKSVPLTFVEREVLDQKVKRGPHQNVLAIVDEIPYASLEEILQRPKQEGTQALLLVLDGIQDPQNLGSLIRTGLGCGAHGVILPKDRAAGITPAVVKASAGATAHLPVARVVNIAATIDRLKEEGLWVYGASGEAEEVLYDLDFKTDLAIVIGAEGKGIRPLVKKKCDRLFSIPMKGPVSSFNAAVSGAMILYEAMRQRGFRGERGELR